MRLLLQHYLLSLTSHNDPSDLRHRWHQIANTASEAREYKRCEKVFEGSVTNVNTPLCISNQKGEPGDTQVRHTRNDPGCLHHAVSYLFQ